MKRAVDISGRLLRRGYALLFAFVFIFYLGMAVLPAFLMAEGKPNAGELVYRGFHFLCHQYPWRSWFIGGKQACYPLISSGQDDVLTFEEASGLPVSEISPRRFYGTAEMGYKMAVCQRDTAIYGAMAVFSLLFFLSRNRLARIDWRLWLIFGVLPMGIDGGWQMAAHVLPGMTFRESTPLLRTITGALFGFLTCWYLLPGLERTLNEGEKNDRQ